MQISSSHQVCYGGENLFVAVFSAHKKFSGFRGLVHNYVHYSFCPVTHMFIYPNIKIIFPLHSFFTTYPSWLLLLLNFFLYFPLSFFAATLFLIYHYLYCRQETYIALPDLVRLSFYRQCTISKIIFKLIQFQTFN